MLRHPTLSLLLGTLALLAGCDGRPRDWPSPAPGVWARVFNLCPDLGGHYRIGQHLVPPGRWVDDEEYGPLPFRLTLIGAQSEFTQFPWGTATIAGDAAHELTVTLRRSAERIEAVKTTILAQRHSTPPVFGPVANELSYALRHDEDYVCARGWLVAGPDSVSSHFNEVPSERRITKDARGGLLANLKGTRERMFSLWCGDSCKPSITYEESVSLWGHWSRADEPE